MAMLAFNSIGVAGFALMDFGENGTNEFVLDDNLIFAIARQYNENPLIGTVFRILAQQTTGRGFTITLHFAGHEEKITDPLEHLTLYEHWKKILPDVIIQLTLYGLVVIDIRRKSGLPHPYSEEPRVMDLATEVFVKVTEHADRHRDYTAYYRQKLLNGVVQGIKLENAMVYVATDPTFEGYVRSPLQQVLELCAQLRGYSGRREIQDTRATMRERTIWYDGRQRTVMDTDMELNTATLQQHGETVPGYRLSEIGGDKQYKPGNQRIQIPGSLEHQKAVISAGNAFLHAQDNKDKDKGAPTSNNGIMPPTLSQRHYNPLLGRWTDVPLFNFWEPYQKLNQFERLENQSDYNFVNAHYVDEYNLIVRQICSRFGVPFEWVIGGKIGLTSEVEFSLKQFDTSVRALQTNLELIIARLYIAIYGVDFIDRVKANFNKAAFESEAEENKRELAEEEEEERNGSEPGSKRRKRDGDEEEDTEKPSKKNRKFFLTDDDIDRIKALVKVVVHFNENPVITQQVIDHFETKGYITRDTAALLSFQIAGLPESYIATEEELLKQAKFKRKLDELQAVQPEQPKKPGESGSKPDQSTRSSPKEKKPEASK